MARRPPNCAFPKQLWLYGMVNHSLTTHCLCSINPDWLPPPFCLSFGGLKSTRKTVRRTVDLLPKLGNKVRQRIHMADDGIAAALSPLLLFHYFSAASDIFVVVSPITAAAVGVIFVVPRAVRAAQSIHTRTPSCSRAPSSIAFHLSAAHSSTRRHRRTIATAAATITYRSSPLNVKIWCVPIAGGGQRHAIIFLAGPSARGVF